MTLVSPSRTITIAGKGYVLDGSFGTLRAVQEAFQNDIVQVLLGVMDMRLDQVARLMAIGSGSDAEQIGQAILDDAGAMSQQYAILKTELVAWLNVAVSPKADREKKRAEMDALIQKQSASLGPTINVSPSAPSDGSQASSGEATSGN